MTPLDGEYRADLLAQGQFRGALLWRPDADKVVVRAAGEQSFVGVPLDLFDHLVVPLPLDERYTGLVYAPQVDEPALASDCYVLGVLPLDLEALELWVDLRVIEAGHLATIRGLTVPDIDLAHEAASCDQVVCLVAELALHETLVEVLALVDVDLALRVHFPDACHHI